MGSFTRRELLFAGGAAVGVLLIGSSGARVIFNSTGEMRRWMREIIARYVPDAKVPNDVFTAFAKDFLSRTARYNIRHVTLAVAESFVPKLPLPAAGLKEPVEEFERLVITEFLTHTTYFQLEDPASEPLTYLGGGLPCANPFANFS